MVPYYLLPKNFYGPILVIYCIVRLRHYVALAKRGLRELLMGLTPLGGFRQGTGVYGL